MFWQGNPLVLFARIVRPLVTPLLWLTLALIAIVALAGRL
jgi:hypothetical protein